MNHQQATNRLMVVVPLYNEEEVIIEFQQRLSAVLRHLPVETETLYVNDGSTDGTRKLLQKIQLSSPNDISIINFTRNFGKEVAISAGLDHVDADAIIVIDADLQDPPELIPNMLLEWRRGFDVVCMQRSHRQNEGFFKRNTARLFYRLIAHLGSINIPANVGDFRLLSRRAVMSLRQLPERTRFMKGLFAWIGYPTITLKYHRSIRNAGKTKFRLNHLTSLALDGVTSFSTTPLRLASYAGILVSFFSFAYGTYIIGKAALFGDPVAGFPSLIATITFIGGMQLLAIGLLGEYLGRIFIETKQRPLYLVETYQPAKQIKHRDFIDDKPRQFISTHVEPG
ncbi:MAG: glycosyltransferase family 2 protein [Gammaproteobacteria bacterium]|nr:MAG: glycosyltransferase family 2 protein [Gammaproteobacteria bacterium]